MKRNIYRKLLSQAGETGSSLSRALNLSEHAFSHYINGTRYPRLDIGWKIIKFARRRGIKLRLEDLYPESDF